VTTTADVTKAIIASSVAADSGYRQVLAQLESLGVEWFVTNQGDLMVKSWQVVSEGFVSPGEVPFIGQHAPPEADPLNWVSAHLEELRAQYPGQWIAVVGNQIQAAAPTLPALLALVNAQGIQSPFVTQIPAGDITWNLTYAGQDV
jgi:hypothetical protein